MGCLGVHFALTENDVATLRSHFDEQDRLHYLINELEEGYFSCDRKYLAESDKAWDAMHRVLADGELTWDGGEYPFNHVVMAGESLYGSDDYIMILKSPQQVKDIAEELPNVTEAEFRKRYFAIDPESYGMDLSEEDFGYTWENFKDVRDLYLQAAKEDRYVLFTASQ